MAFYASVVDCHLRLLVERFEVVTSDFDRAIDVPLLPCTIGTSRHVSNVACNILRRNRFEAQDLVSYHVRSSA